MKTIYEDEILCATTTGHDFDFIAIIENKTESDIEIEFDEIGDWALKISNNNYIGLLADENGREMLEHIKSGNFRIKTIGE